MARSRTAQPIDPSRISSRREDLVFPNGCACRPAPDPETEQFAALEIAMKHLGVLGVPASSLIH